MKAVCRRAKRVGNRDSVGEANGDASDVWKASIEDGLESSNAPIEAFLGF